MSTSGAFVQNVLHVGAGRFDEYLVGQVDDGAVARRRVVVLAGLAFRKACSSPAFLAGTLAGLTTSTNGVEPTTLTGAMSATLS